MPNMLGTELAEQMRAQHPGLRVIFMSGSPLPSGVSGIPPGSTALQKPFMVDELLRTVAEALSRPQKGSGPAPAGPLIRNAWWLALAHREQAERCALGIANDREATTGEA